MQQQQKQQRRAPPPTQQQQSRAGAAAVGGVLGDPPNILRRVSATPQNVGGAGPSSVAPDGWGSGNSRPSPGRAGTFTVLPPPGSGNPGEGAQPSPSGGDSIAAAINASFATRRSLSSASAEAVRHRWSQFPHLGGEGDGPASRASGPPSSRGSTSAGGSSTRGGAAALAVDAGVPSWEAPRGAPLGHVPGEPLSGSQGGPSQRSQFDRSPQDGIPPRDFSLGSVAARSPQRLHHLGSVAAARGRSPQGDPPLGSDPGISHGVASRDITPRPTGTRNVIVRTNCPDMTSSGTGTVRDNFGHRNVRTGTRDVIVWTNRSTVTSSGTRTVTGNQDVIVRTDRPSSGTRNVTGTRDVIVRTDRPDVTSSGTRNVTVTSSRPENFRDPNFVPRSNFDPVSTPRLSNTSSFQARRARDPPESDQDPRPTPPQSVFALRTREAPPIFRSGGPSADPPSADEFSISQRVPSPCDFAPAMREALPQSGGVARMGTPSHVWPSASTPSDLSSPTPSTSFARRTREALPQSGGAHGLKDPPPRPERRRSSRPPRFALFI